jgi:prepilin-type N-terminal cleavage/methylation domain-containing protein
MVVSSRMAHRRIGLRPRLQRPAFTLVELMVVVAIIAVLVAMLLPAVQAARESARRTSCGNNLRQLALGCQQHLDQQGFLPSGGWGWGWAGDPDRGLGPSQPGSWAYGILPYLEQSSLFALPADAACAMPLPAFACPTRRSATLHPTPVYGTTGETMRNATTPAASTLTNRSDYKMNGGSMQVLWGVGPTLADATAGNGFTSMSTANGLVAQRSEIRAAHVRDGMTNTYLVGEKYLDPANYATGVDWSDDHSMFVGGDLGTVGWTHVPPAQDLRGDVNTARFGSAHVGGFTMAMADGSTIFVGYDVDATAHRLRGSRNDGQPTPAIGL